MKINSFWWVIFLCFIFSCRNDSKPEAKKNRSDNLTYLNHSDTARYVGMNTCKTCHQNIYNTFIETGMGKSFFLATREKSAADFSKPYIKDNTTGYRYLAFWNNDSLYFKEYKLDGRDTLHSRTEQVNYIIGSGQHTNSHIQNINGYLHQMPMTFYTQKKKWDLPPGFENGFNTRFSRKIGLECMSCHNGFPDFVPGSENKYSKVPMGIDCERCHGPGSIHVQNRQTQERVDTSVNIDYSIVNPSKLPVDLQFDICQRCHLQGNAVLKEGKSFYDFKPGQRLSDFISVFLPKYKNADDEFIMASHAHRLKQSPCFIKSLQKNTGENKFRPYKDALTCVTCHNPHVSVKHTDRNTFNDACNNCHKPAGKSELQCTDKNVVSARNAKHGHAPARLLDCVNCHMPASGSTDIPHVSVHDHYIRKPITKTEKEKIKIFLGLFSVNEDKPSVYTKAKAYINYYEKFDQKNEYIDSALALLKDQAPAQIEKNIHLLIQLYFMKQNFSKVLSYVNAIGEDKCITKIFTRKNFENTDAWACYRVAESYSYSGNTIASLKWLKQAIKLAPFNLEFRNKLGSAFAANNDIKSAAEQFEFILKENPKHVSAYTNLGFIRLQTGSPEEALRLYNKGLKLDPEYEPLLLNLAGYHAFHRNKKEAVKILEKIIKLNPGNQKAKTALQQINSLL